MSDTSITMTRVHLHRFEVLSHVNSGSINGSEASEKLGLSVRHIRRLKKRVKKKGAEGLLHGNKGKTSTRKIENVIRDEVRTLMTTIYKNFGPTFAAEKLAERDAIHVSPEWLRSFMIREKLWVVKEKGTATPHRSWRPRMELEGSMEQFDGSYHRWLTLLDEELCLLLSIDDAKGEITKARFEKNEGVDTVFTFWKERAEKERRLPKRLYVDKFSTYKVNHTSAVDDPRMITQFDRALRELGVELICAHSPQAKGRVERVFGTLQDRLVKEMTLAGVKTVDDANAFLQKYIPEFNQQFGVKAAKEGDAYVSIPSTTNLDRVFSVQEERRVANDFTVRFENDWYQIEKEQSATVLPRDAVVVEKRLDGTNAMRLVRNDHYLKVTKLPLRPVRAKVSRILPATARALYVPPSNHPWRRPILCAKNHTTALTN
jgi:transposase